MLSARVSNCTHELTRARALWYNRYMTTNTVTIRTAGVTAADMIVQDMFDDGFMTEVVTDERRGIVFVRTENDQWFVNRYEMVGDEMVVRVSAVEVEVEARVCEHGKYVFKSVKARLLEAHMFE